MPRVLYKVPVVGVWMGGRWWCVEGLNVDLVIGFGPSLDLGTWTWINIYLAKTCCQSEVWHLRLLVVLRDKGRAKIPTFFSKLIKFTHLCT